MGRLGSEKDSDLTLQELKRSLDYNPETGFFSWKIPKRGLHVGDKAGSINDQGYIILTINLRRYRGHRLAWFYMTGSWPVGEIDHEDGIRSNNSWSNLRDVPRLENKRNQGRITTNTSGYNGVMWYKAGQKWHAQISISGEKIHLGYFEDIEDAIKARKDAEDLYGFHETHGEKDSWNRKNNARQTQPVC